MLPIVSQYATATFVTCAVLSCFAFVTLITIPIPEKSYQARAKAAAATLQVTIGV